METVERMDGLWPGSLWPCGLDSQQAVKTCQVHSLEGHGVEGDSVANYFLGLGLGYSSG